MHKWRSNYAGVLFETNNASNFQTISDERDVVKILGLRWVPERLQFESEIVYNSKTKREILSSISKLFDPFGLASPTVVRAKLIMQRIWQLKLG